VPFEVKGDPDELFGFYKERLVRPLGVYARARDQGESGWGFALKNMMMPASRTTFGPSRVMFLILERPDEETIAAPRRCFKKIAHVSAGTLQNRRR